MKSAEGTEFTFSGCGTVLSGGTWKFLGISVGITGEGTSNTDDGVICVYCYNDGGAENGGCQDSYKIQSISNDMITTGTVGTIEVGTKLSSGVLGEVYYEQAFKTPFDFKRIKSLQGEAKYDCSLEQNAQVFPGMICKHCSDKVISPSFEQCDDGNLATGEG